MDLAHVAVGPEGDVDVKIEGGMVKLILKYNGADTVASLEVGLKPQAFVEKLKKAIPGSIDDMIFDLILAQLNK